MKLLVEIYRSSKKEGMYLYTKRGAPLEDMPSALMQQFGKAESAMTLVLTPDRKLAMADAKKVIESIESEGFYLQMPPRPEMYMQDIPNDKLTQQPVC